MDFTCIRLNDAGHDIIFAELWDKFFKVHEEERLAKLAKVKTFLDFEFQ